MDLATLIGLVGAIGVVAAAIFVGASPLTFVNPAGLLIVLAGSLLVVLTKFSLNQFIGSIKVAARAFSHRTDNAEQLIETILEFAQEARRNGLIALEDKDGGNEFLQKGVMLLVDGHSPEVVREILLKDLLQESDRHRLGQRIFQSLGDVAPAMGMIGTLIGLVQMLANMEDPKAIGPAMAVALLTTLYGALLANVVALPIADKLALRSEENGRSKRLVIDGVLGIQGGQNPRVIEETLMAYLPGSKRSQPA